MRFTKNQTRFIREYLDGKNNIGIKDSYTIEVKHSNALIHQIFRRIIKENKDDK